ncbi:MAG: hypothetical protein ACFE0I_14705 [Elainellaceae cyanobacterium]
MAEELQLGQSVDEIIANLEYMESLLVQGVKHLQAFGSNIEAGQETLGQSFLLSRGLENLSQSLQESDDHFETLSADAADTFFELQQSLAETHAHLDQASQFIEEAQSNVETGVIELSTEFEQNFGAIEISLADMEESTHQIHDTLDDEIEDTRNSFETLEQSVNELESRVEQFSEVSATFDSLSNEMASHQREVESEFGELNQQLEQEDLDEIKGRIDTAEDTFTQFLKDSEEDINQIAEEKLRDEITELISGFEAVCDGEINPKLDEEFYQPVSNHADDLMNELEVAQETSDNARKAAEIAARDDLRGNLEGIRNAVEEMEACLEVQMQG